MCRINGKEKLKEDYYQDAAPLVCTEEFLSPRAVCIV